MEVFIPCRKCIAENKKDPTVPIGYHKVVSDDAGFFTGLSECTCHQKWRLKHDLTDKLKRHGFNPSIVDYDIKSYKGTQSLNQVQRLEKFIDMFDNKSVKEILDVYGGSVILYLEGPYGTQKTTLANWLARELFTRHFKCEFILMNDLIKLQQRAENLFTPDPEAQMKYQRLCETQFLFIDESFDKEKMTVYKSGYQIPFLDSFLRKRLTSEIATIFISNVAPDDIDISPAIKDLICRNVHKFNTDLLFLDNYDKLRGDYDTSIGLF